MAQTRQADFPKRSAIVIIALLAIGLAFAWFSHTFERVEDRVPKPFGGEAVYNDFYAAVRLVREVGRDSDARASLSPDQWLPPTSDTIVTRVTQTIDTDYQSSLLLQWVDAGGHLILLPGAFSDSDSVLLDKVGYVLDNPLIDEADAEPEPDTEETLPQQRAESEQSTDDDDAAVPGPKRRYHKWRLSTLDGSVPAERLEDADGIYVARTSRGNGAVTVVAPTVDFTNWFLSDPDNGTTLLNLVDGAFEPGKVWFIYSSQFPSLLALALNAFPLTVVALLFLLALWLWSIIPRFGPAIVERRNERRSLGEHIEAAGRFSWRRGDATPLAHAARDALLHDAEIRHPGLGRLSPEKQSERLAAITGMEKTTVYAALYLDDDERKRSFTDRLKTLQTLREHL